jgi:hypothetical protein
MEFGQKRPYEASPQDHMRTMLEEGIDENFLRRMQQHKQQEQELLKRLNNNATNAAYQFPSSPTLANASTDFTAVLSPLTKPNLNPDTPFRLNTNTQFSPYYTDSTFQPQKRRKPNEQEEYR